MSQFYKQKRCFIAQFCFARLFFHEIGGKSYVSLLLVFDVFASLHSSHNLNFYNAHETETELSLKPVINSAHKKMNKNVKHQLVLRAKQKLKHIKRNRLYQ